MQGSSTARSTSSETRFISEVFHDLSQPLTALHCTLDLALQQDRSFEQLRASVQTALDNAERLRQRLLMLRALKEADSPYQCADLIDLRAMVRDLVDDIFPLFESTGKRLELHVAASPLLVHVARGRLHRALFAFVEYLFRYLSDGAQLTIRLDRNPEGLAEIRLESESSLPISPDDGPRALPYACEIELVRRTLLAAGGGFELVSCLPDRSVWSATLPERSSCS